MPHPSNIHMSHSNKSSNIRQTSCEKRNKNETIINVEKKEAKMM